jgi:putative tricarboxylic transport membrane protein
MGFLLNRNVDYYGGALMVLIGLAAVYAGSHYGLGTLAHMGPGFFPTAVGAMLAVVGLVIALRARTSAVEADAHSPFDWRAWSGIIGATVAFIVLGEYGGLVPATFAIVFISAVGDRNNTLKQAFWLSAGMVVIAVVVFWWALQLQFELFRWG